MNLRLIIILLVVLVCVGTAPAQKPSATSSSMSMVKMDKSHQAAFQDAMDRLWEDHITWTRLFLVEAAADSPSLSATTDRLLRNQVDIGNAIKPYYGDQAGERLTALLKTHITTAADVVMAAKANNKAKLDDANKRWFANADEIADFLSAANPKNWPQADMRRMMHDHLNLTTTEAVAQLNKNWTGSISAYDQVHDQILMMADMLSTGIIKQFPNKFV